VLLFDGEIQEFFFGKSAFMALGDTINDLLKALGDANAAGGFNAGNPLAAFKTLSGIRLIYTPLVNSVSTICPTFDSASLTHSSLKAHIYYASSSWTSMATIDLMYSS
jgi:hypothetical protein